MECPRDLDRWSGSLSRGKGGGGARGAGAFCSGFVVALTPSDSEKVCLKCNDNTRSKLLPFSIAQQEGNGLVK